MEEIRVENYNGRVTTPICTFNTGDNLLDKQLKKIIKQGKSIDKLSLVVKKDKWGEIMNLIEFVYFWEKIIKNVLKSIKFVTISVKNVILVVKNAYLVIFCATLIFQF